MGQLSGLVCAFLYLLAVAAPLILGAEPANALSWALYYEVGRTFSLLKIVGEAQSLSWMWFVIFTLSVVICFLDIRRERFFVSSFVLVLLLFVTLGVIYMDFILQFQYASRVTLISPWLKIAFLVICGNFMYLALRSRVFQYRRYHKAQKAERETAAS
jgi:hypothetical protein